METQGIVEAARNVQGRFRLMGLSIDERRMPERRRLPEPRDGRCWCGRQGTEKKTGELETTTGRSSDKDGTPGECAVAHDE